jgi:Icc-related predicted phosphoesterase
MAKTLYGILSDTHENPNAVPIALETLKKNGAQKLIVNGDIGTGAQHIAFTLDAIGKSGLESFVQPGSHEKLQDFESVIKHFSETYPNVISAFDQSKVEFNNHALVFLPGSDFLCGGQYQLARVDGIDSGFYKTEKGQIRLTNMLDLKRQITQPDKTIVISHVPRKFDNPETSVDVAYFAEAQNKSVIPGVIFETQIRKQFGNVTREQLIEIARQNGYSLRTENRGNDDLKTLYDETGVTKNVTGHFHESVHRAHDSNGNPIKQREPTQQLFWNASYLDGMKAGVLEVDGETVRYQNIDLN